MNPQTPSRTGQPSEPGSDVSSPWPLGVLAVVLCCLLPLPAHADPPVITFLSPAGVDASLADNFTLHLRGSDLWLPDQGWPWATLTLRRDGFPDVIGQAKARGGTVDDGWLRFWGELDLSPYPPGVWDVIITRAGDGVSGTLEDGFEVLPASGLEIKTLGTWGGLVNAVCVDPANPDIAYVGSGRRLVILNVADPANIVELGSLDLQKMINALKVRDGYAYVGRWGLWASGDCFCVVDVSDLTDPGLVSVTGLDAYDEVELYGGLAYVNSTCDRVEAFDISDPGNAQHRGTVISKEVHAFSVVGDLLYAACEVGPPWESPELRIYELSADPLNPVLVGSVQLDWPPCWYYPIAIAVEGDYAYITTQDPALAVVDVSNPEAPIATGYYDEFFTSNDVAACGGYAYVADHVDGASPGAWAQAKGLAIIDIATDPSNPTLVGQFKTHGSVSRVEVVGSRAYVMDEGEGLIILDLSSPTTPVRLGNWHSPAELRKMDKVGDLLYVTDEWNGITILDVADPLEPALVGLYQTSEASGWWGDNWGIELRDGLAYLAAGWGGIEVVDVSAPAAPALVGGFPFNYCVRSTAMELDGDIAHVGTTTCSGGGFLVNFDVSDLQAIVDVGFLPLGAPPRTIDTSLAGIAHIATDIALKAADVSDPSDPFLIYSGFPPAAHDLAREENVLYVTDGRSGRNEGGLYVLDVADAANPLDLAYFSAPFADGVALQNGLAYLVGGSESFGRGLLCLDVADPTRPVLLSHLEVGGTTHMLVDGRYAYTTGEMVWGTVRGSGLVILDVGIPGDINGDCYVNVTDFTLFASAYGSQLGDPNYNPSADLDGDGFVNITDFTQFASVYGTSCW